MPHSGNNKKSQLENLQPCLKGHENFNAISLPDRRFKPGLFNYFVFYKKKPGPPFAYGRTRLIFL